MTSGLRFSGSTIELGEKRIELPFAISDAFTLGALIIVLYDPDAYAEKWGQFPNLVAVERNGQIRWKAELPTSRTGDRYYRVASRRPLVASSVTSFDCEIDTSTGRIVSKELYK